MFLGGLLCSFSTLHTIKSTWSRMSYCVHALGGWLQSHKPSTFDESCQLLSETKQLGDGLVAFSFNVDLYDRLSGLLTQLSAPSSVRRTEPNQSTQYLFSFNRLNV